jgi:hypothetical protein
MVLNVRSNVSPVSSTSTPILYYRYHGNQIARIVFGTGRIGERAVGAKERQDEFLAKAKEAEEQAAKAQDERSREGWLRIAFGYRDLARADGHQG